jgi:hypothetical protein
MATAPANRTPAQLFALVFGVVYLLVGIVGLFFSGSFLHGVADDKLIAFRLNYFHDIVHILLGLVWIGASRTFAASKAINLLFGAVLLLIALLGFLNLDLMHTLFNITSAGAPDNFLHLVTGLLGVYFGTAGAAGSSVVAPT